MTEPMNGEDALRVQEAKRWYAWLKRGWRWWLVAASVVVPMPLIRSLWGYDFSACNKIHTGLLQIFGVAFFLLGVRDTLRRFKKPGVFERVVAWAKEIPLVRQHRVVSAGAGMLSSFGLTARGRITKNSSMGSVDLRLEALTLNLESLTNEHDEFHREQQKENNALRDSVDQERRDRDAQVGLISGLLEQTTVGGVDDLYLAAAWTLISTVLSTVGPNHLEPVFRAVHLF